MVHGLETMRALNKKADAAKPVSAPHFGLMPKRQWNEMRIEHIKEAIQGCRAAGKEVPQEWVDEFVEMDFPLRKGDSTGNAKDPDDD